MFKNTCKGILVVLGALFLYGCASTEKVEVRRFVEVRERVDQDMEAGNAGYISGAPQPDDRSEIRKTRKIYVVEVSKDDAQDPLADIEPALDEGYEDGYQGAPPVRDESSYEADNLINVSRGLAPKYKDAYEVEGRDGAQGQMQDTSGSVVNYTIEKDDTLQKISKKFYNTYSKWNKIYEYNKGVIDNPDRIKPGIVIKIPME